MSRLLYGLGAVVVLAIAAPAVAGDLTVIVHTHPIAAGGADAGGTATAKGRRVDEFRIFGLRIGGKAILPLVCRTDSRTI